MKSTADVLLMRALLQLVLTKNSNVVLIVFDVTLPRSTCCVEFLCRRLQLCAEVPAEVPSESLTPAPEPFPGLLLRGLGALAVPATDKCSKSSSTNVRGEGTVSGVIYTAVLDVHDLFVALGAPCEL